MALLAIKDLWNLNKDEDESLMSPLSVFWEGEKRCLTYFVYVFYVFTNIHMEIELKIHNLSHSVNMYQ
jgi:hypothetical protein